MTMRYLSLFSGMGGFDLGLDAAGMECAAQCEIDGAALNVLAHHWPDVPHWTDVRGLKGEQVGAVDLLCGGFPCQDLSVAGQRAGLAGQRSGLFWEFARLIAECAPRWVLLENVPGLLSSNKGRDMAAVVGALAERGYGWAYRVLDAQYFGVAQRRRRVFIVGCLGDAGRAAQVLFEPESCGRDTPPRRAARQGVAATLGGGAGSRGWADDTDRMTFVPVDVTAVSPAVTSKWAKGSGGPSGDEVQNLVAMSFQERGRDGGRSLEYQDGTAYSLNAGAGGGRANERNVAYAIRTAQTSANGHGVAEDVAHTLDGAPGQVVAIDWQSGGDVRLNVSSEHTSALQASQTPAVAFDMAQITSWANRQRIGPDRPAPTLHQMGGAHIMARWGVRRLTPTECLALQGFPLDWFDGLRLKDSHKYRLCGNAVFVPGVRWIGERIMAVSARLSLS